MKGTLERDIFLLKLLVLGVLFLFNSGFSYADSISGKNIPVELLIQQAAEAKDSDIHESIRLLTIANRSKEIERKRAFKYTVLRDRKSVV